ncbi:hypothetical protein J7E25_10850 [Agromyces sp. ISL-38]|uniref:hypothetical protein n=1 Tax=Agromyces sp. ISL-38 TaxID=2819107 RepID=UPI001BEBDE87|nr:hypothetical protein [Agromyces sp. ISL-38]MBT2499596.1 hypothetical protein [Agromyces sp. ISL-38]
MNLRALAVIAFSRLALLVGAIGFVVVGTLIGGPLGPYAIAVGIFLFVVSATVAIWTNVVIRRSSKPIGDGRPRNANPLELTFVVGAGLTLVVGALVFLVVAFTLGGWFQPFEITVAALLVVVLAIMNIRTLAVLRRSSKPIDDARPENANPPEQTVIVGASLTLVVGALVLLAVGFSLGGWLPPYAIAVAALLLVVLAIVNIRTLAVLRRWAIDDAPPDERHQH